MHSTQPFAIVDSWLASKGMDLIVLLRSWPTTLILFHLTVRADPLGSSPDSFLCLLLYLTISSLSSVYLILIIFN